MTLSFVDLVEVGGVDRLEARLLDGQILQPAAGRDHRCRRFRPHVAIGCEPPPVCSGRLDVLHARHRRQAVARPCPSASTSTLKPPPSTCRPSSGTVPSSAISPWLNSATRSHTLCTRSSRCEDSSML